MRLREIQERFMAGLPDNLFRARGVSIQNRMKVYRNNVTRSLAGAVMSAYPITKKLVGEEFMERAAFKYVEQNPPARAALTFYGESLPAFIRDYEPARAMPWLYDLARFEWAMEAASYAADDEALDPAALAPVSQDRLPDIRFSFRASFSLLESGYPLDKPDDIGKDGPRVKLMVLRPQLQALCRRLTDDEYAFLAALQAGKTIGQAMEDVADDFDLAARLQDYLTQGLFSGFTVRG